MWCKVVCLQFHQPLLIKLIILWIVHLSCSSSSGRCCYWRHHSYSSASRNHRSRSVQAVILRTWCTNTWVGMLGGRTIGGSVSSLQVCRRRIQEHSEQVGWYGEGHGWPNCVQWWPVHGLPVARKVIISFSHVQIVYILMNTLSTIYNFQATSTQRPWAEECRNHQV